MKIIRPTLTPNNDESVEALKATITRLEQQVAELQTGHSLELADAIPQIVWTAQPDGRVDYFNKLWQDYTGRDAGQTLGHAWAEAVHPDEREQAVQKWRHSLTTGQNISVEYRLRRFDGVYRWYLVRGRALHDAEGQVVKWFGTITDIDDLKQAEARLNFLGQVSRVLASTLDYDSTLQNVVDLAVPFLADWCSLDLLDSNGLPRRVATAHANPAKLELAHHLLELYPHLSERPSQLIRGLLAGQAYLFEHFSPEQLRLAARDEAHLKALQTLELRAGMNVPLFVQGRVVGAFTLAITESDRRYTQADFELAQEYGRRASAEVENAQLYREAQQAIELRDEFLSIAAHELKTPLTSLRGFIQLFLRKAATTGALDLDWAAPALETINSQTGKLSTLVSQLLDISRLEAGRLRLEPVPTELVALVHEVVVNAQATTTNHRLTLDAPAHLEALVDPLRFEQVVVNLVDNAIKYSPAGGPVELVLTLEKSQPPQARLLVRDHGLGIDPVHRAHIFDRFYQAHDGNHLKGMGLGLYITRQIIELHGGRIEAVFPPDGGTCFVIYIPVGL